MAWDYCDGMPLDMLSWDVESFGEWPEAWIDAANRKLIIERFDGGLHIRANYCPMCGEKLGDEE